MHRYEKNAGGERRCIFDSSLKSVSKKECYYSKEESKTLLQKKVPP